MIDYENILVNIKYFILMGLYGIDATNHIKHPLIKIRYRKYLTKRDDYEYKTNSYVDN